jgi:hypothetical protein
MEDELPRRGRSGWTGAVDSRQTRPPPRPATVRATSAVRWPQTQSVPTNLLFHLVGDAPVAATLPEKTNDPETDEVAIDARPKQRPDQVATPLVRVSGAARGVMNGSAPFMPHDAGAVSTTPSPSESDTLTPPGPRRAAPAAESRREIQARRRAAKRGKTRQKSAALFMIFSPRKRSRRVAEISTDPILVDSGERIGCSPQLSPLASAVGQEPAELSVMDPPAESSSAPGAEDAQAAPSEGDPAESVARSTAVETATVTAPVDASAWGLPPRSNAIPTIEVSPASVQAPEAVLASVTGEEPDVTAVATSTVDATTPKSAAEPTISEHFKGAGADVKPGPGSDIRPGVATTIAPVIASLPSPAPVDAGDAPAPSGSYWDRARVRPVPVSPPERSRDKHHRDSRRRLPKP